MLHGTKRTKSLSGAHEANLKAVVLIAAAVVGKAIVEVDIPRVA
jgi:hypothetical protein